MSTVTLTAQNFQEYVEKPGILLIDWWATWCGPCRAFAPIYEKAAEKNTDVVFGKIDTDAEQELAMTFEIRSIPTLMIFRDQVLVFARPGMIPGPGLDELIQKVKDLDMDDVRRKVAADEAAHAASEKAEAEKVETGDKKAVTSG
ncbi:MAG: thiol reductase thioredoxin [Myxococcales bacterium]|jgi:thioredoxin 1|nr:thiol reductase thioredoxin [Myxococcales bacterium]